MKTNLFKIAFLIVVLLLGYLFAINGRYFVSEKHGVVIDKWEQKVIPWGKFDKD